MPILRGFCMLPDVTCLLPKEERAKGQKKRNCAPLFSFPCRPLLFNGISAANGTESANQPQRNPPTEKIPRKKSPPPTDCRLLPAAKESPQGIPEKIKPAIFYFLFVLFFFVEERKARRKLLSSAFSLFPAALNILLKGGGRQGIRRIVFFCLPTDLNGLRKEPRRPERNLHRPTAVLLPAVLI